MEVTHLWIQSLINSIVLLATQPAPTYTFQTPDLPVISPDRLQFFEYETVSLNSSGEEDMNAWRVMRKLYKTSQANISEDCSTPVPSCTIQNTFKRHSGQYWCENDKGERSRAVSIYFTDGSVILNVPARPVREGSDVTLHCMKQFTNGTHISDFYKDGAHNGTYYKVGMTLSKVSKADEGFYKYKISSAGESPESCLAVVKPIEEEVSNKKTQYLTSEIILVLRTIPFLCLVIGLIFLVKWNGGKAANQPDKDTYPSAKNQTTGQDGLTAPIGQYSSEQGSMFCETSF